MQENPKINQQDRQKITFPGYANPKEISQQYTPAIHTETVYHQRVGPLVGLPSVSRTIEGSWIHLWGRVAKPLFSSLTPVPPKCSGNKKYGEQSNRYRYFEAETGR